MAEGDVPARYEFLISVAKTYGLQLLLETKLPWITLRESPGNAILVSIQEFMKRAKAADEILVVYGVSAWSAEKFARSIFPQASKSALTVPVSTIGQPDPGTYDDEDEIIEAELTEHFGGKRS